MPSFLVHAQSCPPSLCMHSHALLVCACTVMPSLFVHAHSCPPSLCMHSHALLCACTVMPSSLVHGQSCPPSLCMDSHALLPCACTVMPSAPCVRIRRMLGHTNANARVRTYARTPACTCMRTHMCAYAYMPVHIYACARACTHNALMRKNAHTAHAHVHAKACTCAPWMHAHAHKCAHRYSSHVLGRKPEAKAMEIIEVLAICTCICSHARAHLHAAVGLWQAAQQASRRKP